MKEGNMTVDELYMFVFNKLEKMYFQNIKKYNQLGIILGQMSPAIFKDSGSADPAVTIEFNKLLLVNNNTNNFSKEEGIDAMKKLLIQYNVNYGYDIESVLLDFDTFFDQL